MSKSNSLTKQILLFLSFNGFFAWRENTTGVYDSKKGVYRAGNNMRGKSDILGIRKLDGKLIAIEVKVDRDKVSVWQQSFLDTININNGLTYIARDFNGFLNWFNSTCLNS